MARRYLSLWEAAGALRRGKAVECFVGKCERNSEPGVRWLSVHQERAGAVIRIYETAVAEDSGSVDLYSFESLNSELDPGEPDEQISVPDLDACWALLEKQFPGSTARLVNEGVIQDEYADFLASGRRL